MDTKLSYKPIYIIFTYLVLINIVIGAKFGFANFMPNFMASFFLVFSFFKILDVDGFAKGYKSYDLVAKKCDRYARSYPYIELAFGILYILLPNSLLLNIVVLIVMSVSTLGVLNALVRKQKIQCACVGTFLNVPLGSIAVIEDVLMVIMSLMMVIKLI